MENIVEAKPCNQCGTNFIITDKDLEFYNKISPIFAGKKYSVPTPTLCPDCRHQRRLSFRNERNLYKRKCDLTGENIISTYSPDSKHTIYSNKTRQSDKWDAMDYNNVFDPNKSFFQQSTELFKKVPMGVMTLNCENSDYISYGTQNKDCYLCFCVGYSENCLYSRFIQKSEDCMDCLVVVDCKKCYECTDTTNCFDLKFSKKCKNCSQSYFLNNCTNCSNCFACTNLQNQKYCIFNKQYSKEEYKQKIKEYDLSTQNSIEKTKKQVEDRTKQFPVKNLMILNSENCSGDQLTACENCENCFEGFEAQDCTHCYDFGFGSDLHSCSFVGYDTKLGYEILACEQVYSCIGTLNCIGIKNSYYCISCMDCSNCFGSIGLKHKEYCIFNKQYTEAEYNKIVPQIIEHMKSVGERGEFFPANMSPFGYNETLSQEHYPLTKKDAIKQGFNWMDKEYPINIPEGIETIEAEMLPEHIKDVDVNGESPDFSGSVLKKAIICTVSGKPFRIIKQELEFYRKHDLAIPHKHPDIRHTERMNLRNPRKLFDRKCDKCGIDSKTTYAPEREEKIYCEECYNKEIYG